MVKLDLSNHPAAQDMVRLIMEKKGLPVKEAINFSINHDIYNRILETGYAFIAVDLWGHGGPNRKWEVLGEPLIEIDFDEIRQGLINNVIEKEKVSMETAISYFLLFTMESFGYHI
ncbi:MAG: hypothetical protein FWF04_02780 [Clostridiales bacterium]|nr:hypothetical protein [Clostridiales bacterium]